jgi:hypothetical protein
MRDQYRETGDKAYLRLAEKTEAWLQPKEPKKTPNRYERRALSNRSIKLQKSDTLTPAGMQGHE